MRGDVFGQRDGQIEAQRQVAVPFLETVDLLLRLSPALGQENIRGFDNRGIQRIEGEERIGVPQDLHHALHLHLVLRQKLHKAGEGSGFYFHVQNLTFSLEKVYGSV